MPRKSRTPGELREACIAEALRIVEGAGVEALSMREVSRRLGVSHQAPYKHFASRDHILAEIVERAYGSFVEYLEAIPETDDPTEDMAEMGRRYMKYALTHPLQYRLMFESPLPEPRRHPEMMRRADRAFTLLRTCLKRMSERWTMSLGGAAIDTDALFVWATLHGLASILRSSALRTLELPDSVIANAVRDTLIRIGVGIGAQTRP